MWHEAKAHNECHRCLQPRCVVPVLQVSVIQDATRGIAPDTIQQATDDMTDLGIEVSQYTASGWLLVPLSVAAAIGCLHDFLIACHHHSSVAH